MPIAFDLDPDGQLVVVKHIGDVPDDEFLTFYQDFFDGPGATAHMDLLIDLEQTRSIARSSQALRTLARLIEEKLADTPAQRKVAVIAPADNSFALARMYEVFGECVPWTFVVFRDGESARAWLGASRGLED